MTLRGARYADLLLCTTLWERFPDALQLFSPLRCRRLGVDGGMFCRERTGERGVERKIDDEPFLCPLRPLFLVIYAIPFASPLTRSYSDPPLFTPRKPSLLSLTFIFVTGLFQ